MTTHIPIPVAFAVFDAAHPEVYRLFKFYARQLKNKSKKGSARLVIERLRWEVLTGKYENEEYKINNNYTPHYARKLIADDPSYADFFAQRELKNVEVDPGSPMLLDEA
jgi:hypothetical protein